MFFGRNEELKEIKGAINNNKFESILIYGRRRIGKTYLIDECLKDNTNKLIRFECKRTSVSNNLNDFCEEVCRSLNLENISFKSFNDVFNYIFTLSIKEKIILVIDEFSYLLNDDLAIDSELARTIDKYKTKSNIKLIISGSYVRILEKMISIDAHLYGRFTHILCLKSLNYYEVSGFYSKYSDEDKIKLYSVFGGIPYFNSLIDTSKSADENIINLMVKKDSILEHEINEIILNETSKIEEMNIIIELLAKGINKYNDIYNSLNKKIKLEYYLEKLIEMDIIEKVVPINETTNKKKTFYLFKENTINFYYRYIYRNYNARNILNPKAFYNELIVEDMNSQYIPSKFEDVSKQFLIKLNKEGKIKPLILDIGTYSFNDSKNKVNRQFDVVTLDKNGYISYECKYINNKIDNSIISEEEYQSKILNIGFYKLGFISKKGFKNNIDREKYKLFELKDFYK